jgi:hypothetical protein
LRKIFEPQDSDFLEKPIELESEHEPIALPRRTPQVGEPVRHQRQLTRPLWIQSVEAKSEFFVFELPERQQTTIWLEGEKSDS